MELVCIILEPRAIKMQFPHREAGLVIQAKDTQAGATLRKY